MASMSLDKPLDEIIKSDPSARRGGRRGGGGGGRKRTSTGGRATDAGPKAGAGIKNQQRAANASAANAQKAPLQFPGRGAGAKTGSKIILSNLPIDVNEAQVKELFSSSIGPLKKIAMVYNKNGTSSGVCTVEFQRAEDAGRAYTQYNNRLIDGKRALKIEVIVDPSKVPLQTGGAVAGPSKGGAGGNRGKTSGGAAPARGGASRGRGKARAARPKKTAQDLDAEMEDYAKAGQNDTSAPAV